MFKIYKGGDTFFQWDIGQRLIVEDPEIDKVHFCNKTKDCSLVCEVYEEDGLHLVNVPNILLQDTFRIRVFGCLVEGEESYFAKDVQVFKVVARTKPEDYVYEEEEVLIWRTLDERVTGLDERVTGLDERISALEEAYSNLLDVSEVAL